MKKLLSLLLALVMVFSLAACANTDTPAAEPDAPATTPSDTPSDPTATEVPPVEPTDDALTEITLPLTEEKKELSVWLIWTNDQVADPNTLETVQYIEELTNVHVNFITVSAADAAERFQIMTASNQLPDIILAPPSNQSVDDAIGDGWAIDMSDLVAKYMPNYRAYLAENEFARKSLSASDGVIKTAANISGNDSEIKGEMQWAGLVVRTDLIEKAGYTGPLETIEDYHQMLLTCKANLEGLDAPLYVGATGYGITGSFLSAYGVTNSIMEIDGKVAFGPVQEGYGQWLDEMRTWYSEGLIDPNFDTVGGLDIYMAPASVVGTNKTVCFTTLYNNVGTIMPMVMGNVSDPTAVITPVLNPVLNSGDQPMIINVGTGSTTYLGDGSWTGQVFISADCKEPELAAMWLDWLLTEEAMVASHYGKEGVHYEVDTTEGAPFKYVYKEGYQTEEERKTTLQYLGVGRYNWDAGAQTTAASMAALTAMYAAQGVVVDDSYQDVVDTKQMWNDQGYIRNMLNIVPNAEEMAAIATTKTDIDTRVSEYTVQYIKGQTDVPFTDFCAELEAMGLQSVIDTYQIALDRFNAK